LTRYRAHTDARSELERLLDRLCAERGIPRPQANVVVHGRIRDFVWPEQGLVVEADSYGWHRSPDALDADRERDVELTLAGLRGLRFTHEQITARPAYVAGAILAALA
jgi:very-short-patch-repair endonuclease